MILKSEIRRLIVFGCSYANGEEILYHELGNDLESLRIKSADDPRIFFDEIEKRHLTEQLKEIQTKQFEYAWPAKLSKLLNVECINFSESGNSMQKMLWQFLNYKDQLLTSDLVLFSQTKAERNLHFKDFPMPFQIASINGPIKNSILGISKTGNVSSVIDKSTDSAIINWFTDDRIIWDFIGSLHSLEYFKQFYNLFLIPTMSLSNVELQYYNKELFEKELNSHPNLYLGNKGLDDFAAEEEYLCWGHPVESVHERFANYLYKELTNV